MATTEATLVATYTQGMQLISSSGGVSTCLLKDEIHISPIFVFKNIDSVELFVQWLSSNFQRIKEEAEQTTRYGKLIKIEPIVFDRNVVVKFYYTTGDAMGLNIINLATDAACKFIISIVKPEKFYLQPSFSSVKKLTNHNYITGYGKTVLAEVELPKTIISRFFKINPEDVIDYYHRVRLAATHSGMFGLNGHAANAIAAIFIACGQDPASVVESHVTVTNYEITSSGNLYASVKIPNLVIGTVGGGTGLGTSRECLEILDCNGTGKAKKLAEIIAATVLAGEITICLANASGAFPEAFQKYRKKQSNYKNTIDASL